MPSRTIEQQRPVETETHLDEESLEALDYHPDVEWYKAKALENFREACKGKQTDNDTIIEAFNIVWDRDYANNVKFLAGTGLLDNWEQHVAVIKEQRRKEQPVIETGPVNHDSFNIEAKGWRDVQRATEVDVVGDLHGSFTGFKENLKSLGIVNELPDGSIEWKGGNRKVIFVGDILADRHSIGHDILLEIPKLQKQAEAVGGRIDFLAGNHDDIELSFLMGRPTAHGGDPIENAQVKDQGLGLRELYEFGSERLKNYDWKKFEYEQNIEDPNNPTELKKVYDPVWELMRADRDVILENMRSSEKGRALLEQICKYKIGEIYDDVLYVHTNVTEAMANTLLKSPFVGRNLKETMQNINNYFQSNLKAVLLEGKEPDEYFDKLRAIFLDTSNRHNFNTGLHYTLAEMSEHYKQLGYGQDKIDKEIEKVRPAWENAKNLRDALKALGINAVIHGHSEGDQYDNFENQEMPIISADMAAFKNAFTEKRSIVRVRKNGIIERSVNPRSARFLGKKIVPVRTK